MTTYSETVESAYETWVGSQSKEDFVGLIRQEAEQNNRTVDEELEAYMDQAEEQYDENGITPGVGRSKDERLLLEMIEEFDDQDDSEDDDAEDDD